jgi:hypothetical protein
MSIQMETSDFAHGVGSLTAEDFEAIKDTNIREMMKNAYDAITMAEGGWDYMKNFNEESFMFSSNPMVRTISANMEALGYNGHSGASFGWTMRTMEYLAKYGKEAFITKFSTTES